MSLNISFLKIHDDARIPERQHPTDAGWDLCAVKTVTIASGGRALVQTGLSIAIPEGYEGQVRPRSGLAIKRGLTLLNSPGTIDSGYRGEVCVILHNTDEAPQTVNAGDRIAQIVFAPVITDVVWEETGGLPDSDRGEGGFGHTGE